MPNDTLTQPDDSGNPLEPKLTRFVILKYGAEACTFLLEFLELLEIIPPSGPLAPATELSVSKEEIRGRIKADPEKYLERLVTIETRLRLAHIWPGNLEQSRTYLEAWASLTTYKDTPEEFAKLLYLIE